jgi:hypothetical protein
VNQLGVKTIKRLKVRCNQHSPNARQKSSCRQENLHDSASSIHRIRFVSLQRDASIFFLNFAKLRDFCFTVIIPRAFQFHLP